MFSLRVSPSKLIFVSKIFLISSISFCLLLEVFFSAYITHLFFCTICLSIRVCINHSRQERDQSSCLSTDGWIMKNWYVYKREYCSSLRKNEISKSQEDNIYIYIKIIFIYALRNFLLTRHAVPDRYIIINRTLVIRCWSWGEKHHNRHQSIPLCLFSMLVCCELHNGFSYFPWMVKSD